MILLMIALSLLYMMTILSFFAPLSLVGMTHSLNRAELSFTVLLNAMEALAVYVVYRSSDAPHAIFFAAFMWLVQALFAAEAMVHVDTSEEYSKERAVIIMAISALSFVALSILAFG